MQMAIPKDDYYLGIVLYTLLEQQREEHEMWIFRNIMRHSIYGYYGIGGGGGSSSGRTGTQKSENGVNLKNRILNEKKTELDGMVKWTSENNREIGCLITMDKNGVIHFVDVREASEQEPNHISWWNPQIPEGHTYIGIFHTHTSSSLFSGPDFDASRSTMMTFENSLGAFTIDIMICPDGNDFKLHTVVIDNSMSESYFNWVWYDVRNGNTCLPFDSPSTIYKNFERNNFNMNWGYYMSDKYKLSAPYRSYPRGILPPP